MTEMNYHELGPALQHKAVELGADLAGIARIADLKGSPSHAISGKLAAYKGVGTAQEDGQDIRLVTWPAGFHSALVIGLSHPVNQPELDWWVKSNSDGNRLLIGILSDLADWLAQETGMRSFQLPYHIERGGIFLKDAAVLAGLGCLGRNNLLLTPQYGPRLRLRAILIEADLPSSGPVDFDPCQSCSAPCLEACPQNAFAAQIYTPTAYGQTQLPGRSGSYNRLACNREMLRNEADFETLQAGEGETAGKLTKYCRECELACPV